MSVLGCAESLLLHMGFRWLQKGGGCSWRRRWGFSCSESHCRVWLQATQASAVVSVVVARGLGCSSAHGLFPEPGTDPVFQWLSLRAIGWALLPHMGSGSLLLISGGGGLLAIVTKGSVSFRCDLGSGLRICGLGTRSLTAVALGQNSTRIVSECRCFDVLVRSIHDT